MSCFRVFVAFPLQVTYIEHFININTSPNLWFYGCPLTFLLPILGVALECHMDIQIGPRGRWCRCGRGANPSASKPEPSTGARDRHHHHHHHHQNITTHHHHHHDHHRHPSSHHQSPPITTTATATTTITTITSIHHHLSLEPVMSRCPNLLFVHI